MTNFRLVQIEKDFRQENMCNLEEKNFFQGVRNGMADLSIISFPEILSGSIQSLENRNLVKCHLFKAHNFFTVPIAAN